MSDLQEGIEPSGYGELLARLKSEVRAARVRAHKVVNTELLQLYWTIGQAIRDRQDSQGWGSRVIDRLADDLRVEFPGMRGLSRSNLHYMRQAAGAWPGSIVQQSVGQLPWGHITTLLDKLDDQQLRDWYAAKAAENGWTRKVLTAQIATGLHDRLGAAPTNFAAHLPPVESDDVQALIKDPYVFDFLNLSERAGESDIEHALMDRLQDTLLELGRGFAFIGRQVHFDIDGQDFYADLVFFHVEQLRYVVVELKIGRFTPDYAGQLGFYVAVVDDKLRNHDLHASTVGILLCASRDDAVVRYALANTNAPMAVASYTVRPAEAAQMHLPDPSELEALLSEPIAGQSGSSLADQLPQANDDTDQ